MKTTKLELTEDTKTNDILLDMQFSLPRAIREPSKRNAINPVYMVIKGVRHTLVIEFQLGQDSFMSYVSLVKEFFVFDPDNLPIDDINIGLITAWIIRNFLYKDISYFKESKYEDFNDWKKNSPLVELGVVKTIEK